MMKNSHCCPKCSSTDIRRIPDNGRYASGNNIYTTTITLFGKIPVIRYVCCNCGYVENWVEKKEELDKIRTLGHKDISTTLNIYTDVTKELKRTEFEGLDLYFKTV